MECEKLAQEKTEIQRQYIMVRYWAKLDRFASASVCLPLT